MPGLPVRLERPPLIEAVFEVRFAAGSVRAGDVLPGLIYGKFGGLFDRVESLPVASVPREIREQDPNLRHQPTVRLMGGNRAVLIGDQVIDVSKTPPYTGWSNFKEEITSVIDAAHSTGLVTRVERFSFKCVNVIDSKSSFPLDSFNVKLQVGNHRVHSDGLRLRCEIHKEGFVTILEIGAKATAEVPGLRREGTMISLDVVRQDPPSDFWATTDRYVDAAHSLSKEIFFSLLTDATLEGLQPVWDQ